MTSLSKLADLARVVFRGLVRPRVRSELITRFRYRSRHFQGETFTQPNRYTALFQHCRMALEGVARPRILSFGCSTGEEVESLGRQLPDAEIIGVDINHWCIKQCIKRNTNPKHEFLHREDAAFPSHANFDAVFCMAVFQRTENRSSESGQQANGFMFNAFEDEIKILDGKLKVGGLLYLDHCDFRFRDTSVAERYEALVCDASQRTRERRLFGHDNRAIAEVYVVDRIFAKRTNATV